MRQGRRPRPRSIAMLRRRPPPRDSMWIFSTLSCHCMLILILCGTLAPCGAAMTTGEANADGEASAPHQSRGGGAVVTLDEMMKHVEQLSSKMDTLAHRVQDLLAVTDQEQQLVDHDSLRKPAEKDSRRSEPEARKDTGRPNPQETAERDAAEEFGSEEERGWSAWFTVGVFVHEVWVLLQHANILVNPLCQKLDRNYGVALLRKRMYWVIAAVLAAYWARELLSMWMAVRYFSSLTFRMVVLSTLYHIGKISLITVDARRGWSPTLGIMHLLMDHWHLDSVVDLLLCIKRVSLQAFDTATHALIVRDMLRWDQDEYDHGEDGELELRRVLIVVCAVWAMHAVANLITRKSTATLVVELAKAVVGSWGLSRNKIRREGNLGGEGDEDGRFVTLEGGNAKFSYKSSCSHGRKPCEVCHLLTRDRPLSASAKRVD